MFNTTQIKIFRNNYLKQGIYDQATIKVKRCSIYFANNAAGYAVKVLVNNKINKEFSRANNMTYVPIKQSMRPE